MISFLFFLMMFVALLSGWYLYRENGSPNPKYEMHAMIILGLSICLILGILLCAGA